MTPLNSSRIDWIDHAKGIGIFLVVFGHTLRGLVSSQIIADSHSFQFVNSWIYSFHMPLFFLLSGLFAERLVQHDPGEFVQKKLAAIAWPYLVWSVLQTLLQLAMSSQTNNKISLYALTGMMAHPIMQFWFLYVLFFISLIYYLLRRCRLEPVGAFLALATFWCSEPWAPFIPWFPLRAIRGNGIYYSLGSVINHSRATERIDQVTMPGLVATVVLGYGIVAASVVYIGEQTLLLGLGVTLCGIAASIALAVLLGRVSCFKFVAVLGIYSLEIFVAHTIASAGLRTALQNVLRVQDERIHIVVGTAGGLVMPWLLALLCRRVHAEWLFRFSRGEEARKLGVRFKSTWIILLESVKTHPG